MTSSDDLAFPMYQTDPMHPGLTKRECFALHLMAAHLTADAIICSVNDETQLDKPAIAATKALSYADALLSALRSDQADEAEALAQQHVEEQELATASTDFDQLPF